MSPPIFTPDGSEVSEIVLPDGSTASEVIGPDGNVVFEAGPDIPDTSISRDPDDTSTSTTTDFGIQIDTSVKWPKIDGKISTNTSGATKAYVYRKSDGTLYGSADISGLSAGDIFRIDLDTNMISTETYMMLLDAEGSSWTVGYDGDPSFDYVSSDGDISITNGAKGSQTTSLDANAISAVGKLQ